MRQGSLAPVEEGRGEIVAGALTAVTPVAFASGAILVRAPAAYVVALTARTLQGAVFPPECMDVGLALVSVAEVVQIREYRHGSESPGVVERVLHGMGDSHICVTIVRPYKPRDIERPARHGSLRLWRSYAAIDVTHGGLTKSTEQYTLTIQLS